MVESKRLAQIKQAKVNESSENIRGVPSVAAS